MEFEVRASRRPQGRFRLVAERRHYFELMAQGYSSKAACLIVGINEKTGREWRNGPSQRNRKQPPWTPSRASMGAVLSSRYLSESERIQIADGRRQGWGVRKIAAALGRSPSSISRELVRNGHPRTGDYRPHAAHFRAMSRLPRPKRGKIAGNPALQDYIQAKLDLRWSPEQIVRMLRRAFPDRPEMHVVHETIYLALYVQGRGELRRELHRALRTGRARRKPRRQAQQRQPRYKDPMVMISDRPAEVEDRAVPGHWEGDLIIGRNHKSAIGTLVERTTRYVMLLHLPNDHTAETVRDALTTAVETLPAHLRRSLTWDQGSEMNTHRAFTVATGVPVYFCDPASPWQRGSNENTNGLLRQYFPKGTDLSAHTPEDLARVAHELNTRPRKTLDWDTPAERLARLIDTAA